MTADAGLPAGSRAVLIGVSEYQDAEFPPIRAARNSLQAMQSVLADPALCGWPPEVITVIADPISAGDLAVRVADITESTTGVLLLYYVGHGVLSTRGELCLTVTSSRPNRPKITGLPWETIAEELRHCPAWIRLAILDCCFAGQAIESLGADAGQGLADITHVDGVYTLAATTRNRTAHVPPARQQDLACTSFTGELQALIRSGIPGKPSRLTFSDIFPELRQQLRAKGLPAPSQRGTDTAEQFPFTANAAARNQTVDTGPGQYSGLPSDTAASHLPRLAHTLTGHEAGVDAVAFSPDGRLLASIGDSTVRLWDPATGEHRRTLWCYAGGAHGVAFSPDGRLLAGSAGESAWLWDPATGKARHELRHGSYVWGVAFSPDGRLLATGVSPASVSSTEAMVWLWDPATGNFRKTLAGHTGAVIGVAFSPDGRLLATSSTDATVRLWDPATGEHRRTLTSSTLVTNTRAVNRVAFSPGGRLLGTSDGTAVWLWDPATGKCMQTLPGHTGTVDGMAFSPDGRLLATGDGAMVWLRDPATGEHQDTLFGHTGVVHGVAFSPDGRLLATSAGDKTVRLWDLSRG